MPAQAFRQELLFLIAVCDDGRINGFGSAEEISKLGRVLAPPPRRVR
jgi:hypothetical protein